MSAVRCGQFGSCMQGALEDHGQVVAAGHGSTSEALLAPVIFGAGSLSSAHLPGDGSEWSGSPRGHISQMVTHRGC